MKINKIFFNEINSFSLPLMIFFVIFGFKVYFLRASSIYNGKKIANYLKYLNIIKIDFNNSKHSISSKYFRLKEKSLTISNRIADKIIRNIWLPELKKKFIEKNFFKIFLTNYLKIKVYETLILFEFANKIQLNKEKSYFWINKNMISKEALKNYINFIVLKPSFLNFFSDLIKIIFPIMLNFISKLKKKKIKKRRRVSKRLNLKKYKTIFFVNGGIVGANSNYLNFKNFFFSKKRSSPINKNNIVICETAKSLDPASLNYFYKLKLNFFFWYNKRVIIFFKSSFFLFVNIIFKPSLINDLTTSLRICWATLEINSNIKMLNNLPNLKNAIFDNEFQFPTTLAIALKHKGIKINCITKRLIYPAQKHQFIVDNYFIFGKQTIKDLKHQFYKKINPIIVGGHESMPVKNTSKYLKKYKKSYNLTCLVLDYHSDKNWYNSSINPLTNWLDNLKFYELILKISQHNPKILFVLKGKFYDWTRISFFESIYKKFNKQKNIIFFSNKVKMTNHEMTQNVDFSIARWTSLVDDFLMNNKPVIIYDKPHYITGLIKYPSKIMSYNFNDLMKKTRQIQKNIKNYNSLLYSFRKKHYSKFNLKKCQSYLVKVLK